MLTTQSNSGHINREQVRQQLAALGYKVGDTVYLRAFYPSSDPRKTGDAGRKAEATKLDQLIEHATRLQAEGRGVYLVVNGGGHTDKHVNETRAIFYEHDNLDKSAQVELWRGLGLPEPTLLIDTGGKSIHSYWVFDEFVAVSKWRSLQTDLLEFADADRSLKNPSRVMRLAGAWHSSGNQSTIARNSGKRYTYDELRAIVPTKEKPEPTQSAKPQAKPENPAGDIPDTFEDITVPVPASVPLEMCLAKSSRELLGGISEGGRNEAGAKLARDLIGTANYLQAIGQAFDGDPQQMLFDFATRCNPPLPKREAETIWKSAQKGSPTPACKTDGVENCIKGWYWKNYAQKPSGRFVDGQTDQPTRENKLGMWEAASRAKEILKGEPNEVSANIKLEEVRQKTSFSEYAWEHKIIKPLKRDMDAERFKLELLSLLQMEDPVERCRQIALLAPKYSMGAGTIKEAMSAMKQRTQAPKVEVLGIDAMFDAESEAIDWLVPGFLPAGETVLLCALPKVGKSKLAIDLSFCVATGESKFLGQQTKQGKVLLITPDASQQSLKHELLKRGFRRQDKDAVHIIPRWSIDQLAVLEAELEDFRPDLVVIDSLKRITAGKEVSENSAEFADNIIALNDLLTRYRASGILVHHANKGADAVGVERARGSTAIVGACWGTWMLDRIPKQDPNNKKKMIADPKCPKRIFTATNRDSEGSSLNIEFNAENNSWDFLGEVGIDEQEAQQQQTHRSRILNILRANPKPLSGPEIMELLGVGRDGRGSIYSELGRMETKRLISSKPAPGDKRYNLYSLPDFTPSCPADSVTVGRKNSLPPPPPTLSVSVANYTSETITEYGLENSQQNSQQIVSKKTGCDSSQNAELSTNNGIDSIVSREAVSQGGGGVKPILEPSSHAVLTHELTQELEPQHQAAETGAGEIETGVGEIETDAGEQSILAHDYARRIEAAIEFNSSAVSACINIDLCEDIAANKIIEALVVSIVSDERYQVFKSLVAKQTLIVSTVEPATELGFNESEVELVEFVQLAIVDNDSAFVKDVQSIIKGVCDSGAADREKVWGALTRASQAAFKALLKSQPESEPFVQEPEPAPLIDPSDAELIRDIALIWWEQLGENSQSHTVNINSMVSKYSVAWIAQWLTTESETLVRERISDLLRRVDRSN